MFSGWQQTPPPFHDLSGFVGPGTFEKQFTPATVHFPSDQMYSHNFFKPSWHARTIRRLKSTICILEWIPDPAALQIQPETIDLLGPSANNPESTAMLALSFALLNSRPNAANLSLAHTVRFLRCVDVDVEAEEFRGNLKHILGALKRLAAADFRHAIEIQRYYEYQQGRFFIAISLDEAVGIRALMHTWRQYEAGRLAATGQQDPVPAMALRMAMTGAILDATDSFVAGPITQLTRALQCMKFFNGDADYSSLGERFLLRGIQRSDKGQRRQFWLNMCACRRRRQLKLTDEAVARIFTLDNELVHLVCAAIAHRLMAWITAQGWGLSEGYESLGREGVLNLDVLRAQLDQIFKMLLPLPVVEAFFYRLDADKDGQISFIEFKSGLLALTGAAKEQNASDGEAMIALVSGSQTIPILWNVLGKVTLTIAPHPSSTTLWSLPPRTSGDPFTLLDLSSSAGPGLLPIGQSLATHDTSIPCLQIVNNSAADIVPMLDAHFFPYPRAYTLAATHEINGTPLHFWYPLARDYYTALGMVVTKTKEHPPVNLIRTVPLSLTRPSERRPTLVRVPDHPPLPIYLNSMGLLVTPTLSGTLLNFELNTIGESADAKFLTLQDTFTLTSWR